jgi:kumamolisin
MPDGLLGFSDPNEQVEITVHLERKRPESEMKQFLADLAAGKVKPLSPKKFEQRFGARQKDIAAWCRFASANGLTVTETHAGARTVKIAGSAADMTRTFKTELQSVRYKDGKAYRVRTGSYSLPSHLANRTVAILGFTAKPRVEYKYRLLSNILPHDAEAQRLSYSAPEVFAGYGIKFKTKGRGQTIWIGELGGGARQSDVDVYGAKYKLPKCKLNFSGVDGAKNEPNKDKNTNVEVLMDIEIPYGVAPEADFEVTFAPNSGRGFADLILYFAHKSKARRGSISWGMSEDRWDDHEMDVMNRAYDDCAAMGKSCNDAAGDDGSSDGDDDGKDHVDCPANLPSKGQIACGGTNTVIVGGVLQSEKVWNNGKGRGATGGGVSRKYPKPDEQAKYPIKSADGTYEGRLVPDVAGPGDPATGWAVYVDGRWMTVGGTSAVSPMWVGFEALVDSDREAAGKKPVAAMKDELYKNEKLFRPVTVGDNGSYKAGPGFNCCCGLGTPTGALADALVMAA